MNLIIFYLKILILQIKIVSYGSPRRITAHALCVCGVDLISAIVLRFHSFRQ